VPLLLGAAIGIALLRALSRPKVNHVSVSGLELSGTLAAWMESVQESEMAEPWRKSHNLWHTRLGMVLFEKASAPTIRDFWPTYRKCWQTPEDYFGDPRHEAAVRAISRARAGERLTRIAQALVAERKPGESGTLVIGGFPTNDSDQLPRSAVTVDRLIPLPRQSDSPSEYMVRKAGHCFQICCSLCFDHSLLSQIQQNALIGYSLLTCPSTPLMTAGRHSPSSSP
jgi:hypothetical protein